MMTYSNELLIDLFHMYSKRATPSFTLVFLLLPLLYSQIHTATYQTFLHTQEFLLQ
jgi:hypothetical protein